MTENQQKISDWLDAHPEAWAELYQERSNTMLKKADYAYEWSGPPSLTSALDDFTNDTTFAFGGEMIR